MEQESEQALPLRDTHHHRPSDAATDTVQTETSFAPPPPHETLFPPRHTEIAFDRVKDSISRTLGDREPAVAAVIEKPRPLNLLDLPLDVLSLIVKEVGALGLLSLLCILADTLR